MLIFITFVAVLTKKLILSIFLLFTYSLGFAHSFIPHVHTSESQNHEHVHEENGHAHHHHHSLEQVNQDHEHISHGDHFDNGFYEVLICFLHDVNPHKDECSHPYFIPGKSNNTSSNKSQQQKLVATRLISPLKVEQTEVIDRLAANARICYSSPSLEDSHLRGPPTPQC